MRYVYKTKVSRFVQFAVNVMGSSMSIADEDKIALDGIARLEDWFKSIGLPVRLSEVNINGDRIDDMVKQCLDGAVGKPSLNRALSCMW